MSSFAVNQTLLLIATSVAIAGGCTASPHHAPTSEAQAVAGYITEFLLDELRKDSSERTEQPWPGWQAWFEQLTNNASSRLIAEVSDAYMRHHSVEDSQLSHSICTWTRKLDDTTVQIEIQCVFGENSAALLVRAGSARRDTNWVRGMKDRICVVERHDGKVVLSGTCDLVTPLSRVVD